MELCDVCLEPRGGYRCACQRKCELEHTEGEVKAWLALVADNNARLEETGEKGKMKGGFDGMKALSRAARLNIPDLEQRAEYRRNHSAEILGDPMKVSKWRRPRMKPPRNVYQEII